MMNTRDKITVICGWLDDVPNHAKEARTFMEELFKKNTKLAIDIDQLKNNADIAVVMLSCPCNHLDEPCNPNCTCVNSLSSTGCDYCTTYGSKEQQKKTAEYLAGKIKGNGEKEIFTPLLKDWFKESDDGNGGKMLMAECPNCGDAVIYGDGCVKCDAIFEFK